jgi:hypothetical protein
LKLLFFFFLLLFFTAPLIFGQEEQQNYQNIDSIEILQSTENIQNHENLPKTEENGRIAPMELEQKRARNHQYIVVSAVMMMIFAGLCMASVSSLNPE